MRTLFLHCGPAKTGTSAIQAYLRDNSRHPDLLYPQTGQWGDGAHHHIAFALQGMTERGAHPVLSLDRLKADLTGEIAAEPTKDVLISSEGLRPKDSLPAFRETFADPIAGFDRVETLVVLRHPLERAASAYNQNVKDAELAETRLPDTYLAELGRGFALMPFVRRWRQAAPDVVFLNYHPARRLLHRFMTALGRDYKDDGTKRRRNASLGGRATLSLLLANRLAETPAERAAIMAAMRADDSLPIHRGARPLFSTEAMTAFLDATSADLQAVRDELGIDLTELYPAPPAPFTLGPAQAQGMLRRLAPVISSPAQKERAAEILAPYLRP